ncbi:hypothetical protein H4V97_000543 [Flavobacterium sp. CG_23.5]|uniref:hypothetical protein n=1 Tax=unclassified Flavobacterium TaxID=196869 RepID=UPI0018C90ABE|nr:MULTISPECIES: hypothetical protein [unclassified Flavobacterium]MBG6111698.1 hypothetical protein [Flavobacterium sp. CG_9.10]MBP2282225.1 hypothetical protein [Flavobacterium sp. CG_23.5]
MIKPLFFLFLFFYSLQSYSQKLIYKSNGTINDSENNKISPDGVRALLANNEKLLVDYNSGRKKKTIGNIMLYSGLGMVLFDLGRVAFDNAFSDGFSTIISAGIPGSESGTSGRRSKPSLATYIGLASFAAAIPIKIGFSKKIENVVIEYNNKNTITDNQRNNQKLDLITNSNGIGLRLTLN